MLYPHKHPVYTIYGIICTYISCIFNSHDQCIGEIQHYSTPICLYTIGVPTHHKVIGVVFMLTFRSVIKKP